MSSRIAIAIAAIACLMVLSQASPAAVPSHKAKFVVLSEKKGAKIFHSENVTSWIKAPPMQRKAVTYSPLNGFVPERWIPIVASALGALIVSVLHLVANLFKSFVESKISDKAKAKHKITHTPYKLFGIKLRELLSVFAAALVLGLSVSWTFAGPTPDFVWLLMLNVFICVLAGLSHEIIHWGMGRVLHIETEYRFWPSGSLMTIITAVLGNSFGLQGFLLDEVPEGTPKWKLGLMKLAAPLFSAFLMCGCAALNLFWPNVIFQMIFNVGGILAMAEILPFKPMDGYDVRKWNFWVWLAAFLFIFVSFTLVSFIL
jgi:hypothetical protein